MRLPRRHFLIPLLLLMGGWLFCHFQVIYHITGWLRGDAYFQGMPTCYWGDRFNRDRAGAAWTREAFDFLGISRTIGPRDDTIFSKDPEAAPVLIQLMLDGANSPSTRRRAIACLDQFHLDIASEKLAALFGNKLEPEDIRYFAGRSLMNREDKGRQQKSAILPLLKDPNNRIQMQAACLLWAQDEMSLEIGLFLSNAIEKRTLNYGLAANAFIVHSGPEALRFLLKQTESTSPDVRWTATRGVGRCLEILADNKRDREINHTLRQAISGRLRMLENDPNLEVRAAATKATEWLDRIMANAP